MAYQVRPVALSLKIFTPLYKSLSQFNVFTQCDENTIIIVRHQQRWSNESLSTRRVPRIHLSTWTAWQTKSKDWRKKKKKEKKAWVRVTGKEPQLLYIKKNMEASVLVLNRLLSGRFLRRADSQPDNAELPSAIRLMTSPWLVHWGSRLGWSVGGPAGECPWPF